MTAHLALEIDQLKRNLLALSAIVEENLHIAVRAYLEINPELGRAVIDKDDIVDQKEVELEEQCLKILAMYQPVSQELRFIVSALKMNNDLERIGDLASNIAHRALTLSKLGGNPEIIENIELMTQKTKEMLTRSLDALIKMDVAIARDVREADAEIDHLNRNTYTLAHEKILKKPENTKKVFLSLSVSRNLERIADLATNIAEDVIYMVDGEIVRHQPHQILE